MCGRYTLIPNPQAWADVGEVLGASILEALQAMPPRYNVAPTQAVPIIVVDASGPPQLLQARWGYIPSWWKKPVPPTLTTNARSETAAGKPMWRDAWRHQRCLIPASSWYEWYVADGGQSAPPKVPHLIQRADGHYLVFAGLWSCYQPSPEVEPIATCAIVTIPSPPDIAEIHERTPVVLDPRHWTDWLDPTLVDPVAVDRIVAEGAVEHFKMHTVDRSVGNARNTGPEVMTPSLFPEMQAQGTVKPTKESLRWLRKASIAEIEIRLDEQLRQLQGGGGPTLAERRLWVRELRDRDDADQLEKLIKRIRNTLRRKIVEKAPVPKPQGDLF